VAGKNIAVVSTDLGKVRGYIHNGTFTYKGIPYAQSERFMPPTRPKAWSDVRSSTAYGLYVLPTQQQRCLTLSNLHLTTTGVIPTKTVKH
jgi:carboxylesterase type B